MNPENEVGWCSSGNKVPYSPNGGGGKTIVSNSRRSGRGLQLFGAERTCLQLYKPPRKSTEPSVCGVPWQGNTSRKTTARHCHFIFLLHKKEKIKLSILNTGRKPMMMMTKERCFPKIFFLKYETYNLL